MDAEHVISQIQRELDAEVIYQNRKMGSQSELQQALGLPVNVRFDGGTQYVTLDGKTIEASSMASADEIKALLMPLHDIDGTAAAVRLSTSILPQAKPMSVTGLQTGAFQSKLAELKKRIADSQNAGLAKIDATVSDGEKKLTEAADGVAKKAQGEIDDALQEFAAFTNGAPE